MPKEFKGSCHCGGITFSFTSQTPVPYMRCYCSICRKVQGGGGYAINIMGLKSSLKHDIQSHVELKGYQAVLNRDKPNESPKKCGNTRYFCSECSSNLWAHDPKYSEWIYPFASAIDTELPKEADYLINYIMLNSKANWVSIPDPSTKCRLFEDYPDMSIEDWHKKHYQS